MKRTYIQNLVTVSAVGLGLCGLAQAQQPATSGSLQSVEPVTAVSENFTLGKLTGKPVRGMNQEELSTIEDYLVDPQTGRVHFAVVPSGSNTFRIVPMRALQPVAGEGVFTVPVASAQWAQVGTMVAQRLQGNVMIDDNHQQRLMRQFGLPNAESAARNLVRASSLKGRELRAGNEQLGTIEDVVIDYNNQVAAPVLKFTVGGGDQKFTVPMSHLQLSAGQGAITTHLTRNHFQSAHSAAMGPTGSDGWRFGQGRGGPIGSVLTAVQQAIERDAAIPQGTVQVFPETRIVMRGTVENEQKKAEAERAAQQAAPGMRIENQITVR